MTARESRRLRSVLRAVVLLLLLVLYAVLAAIRFRDQRPSVLSGVRKAAPARAGAPRS